MTSTSSLAALFNLLRQGSSKFTLQFFCILAVSGLANAGLLATINGAADQAADDANSFLYLLIFLLVVTAYVIAQRHILTTSVSEVERILHQIRERLSASIRRAGLLGLERIGRAEIYASLHRETVTISQATSTVVMAGQAVIMVIFSLGYLAWLTLPAFLLTILATSVAVILHFRRSGEMSRLLREAHTIENSFFSTLTHVLDGFKEVKLHEPRGNALGAAVSRISANLREVKVKAGTGFATYLISGQTSIYILLACIVFLLPRFGEVHSEVVIKATASVLFIIGPLSMIVASVPIAAQASVAAENIRQLEERLESIATEPAHGQTPAVKLAGPIELDGVRFEYPDGSGAPSFVVGPIDVTIAPGETLFIVGGNGSGKSTLLRVLTGLYPVHGGELRVNHAPVTAERVAEYRALFSAILSDFHLFDRLYGLEHVPVNRITQLLREMELDHKVDVVDGRFTTLDLSHGQKKRLGLIVALLEDRPVLVFDEWAADQDPGFRRHFYEDILPGLKQAGRTVIAATHDDRYFSVADRVIKMENGQFVKETT